MKHRVLLVVLLLLNGGFVDSWAFGREQLSYEILKGDNMKVEKVVVRLPEDFYNFLEMKLPVDIYREMDMYWEIRPTDDEKQKHLQEKEKR